MRARLKEKVVSHLKEDVKGYDKQVKDLKKESSEDQGLIKRILNKMKFKDGKKKEECCNECEQGKDCKGSKSPKRKASKAPKKAGRQQRRRV